MADDKKKLEQERAELNTLINKGVSFEVKDTEFEVQKKFFGLIKRHIPHEVTRTFKIDELTLSTLDRISAETIELTIDESLMKSDDSMKRARGLVHNHSIRCASKIKPSVLYKLYVLVNAMCNLGDFMNSIRLMQQERTTMPIRIEGNNEV